MKKEKNMEIAVIKAAAVAYCAFYALWLANGIPAWAADIAPWGAVLAVLFMAVPSDFFPEEYSGDEDSIQEEGEDIPAGKAA